MALQVGGASPMGELTRALNRQRQQSVMGSPPPPPPGGSLLALARACTLTTDLPPRAYMSSAVRIGAKRPRAPSSPSIGAPVLLWRSCSCRGGLVVVVVVAVLLLWRSCCCGGLLVVVVIAPCTSSRAARNAGSQRGALGRRVHVAAACATRCPRTCVVVAVLLL